MVTYYIFISLQFYFIYTHIHIHILFLFILFNSVYASGNTILNATQAVMNRTRDFFLHGILPMAGLDELDDFLLKKIGT